MRAKVTPDRRLSVVGGLGIAEAVESGDVQAWADQVEELAKMV